LKESTIVKVTAIICSTIIVIVALYLGYDSHLAALAIVGLWGGEKALKKILK